VYEITREDIKAVIYALFKNKLLILLFSIAGLCAGLLYAARNPAERAYTAKSAVSVTYFVSQPLISGSVVLTNYAEMINGNAVTERAAEMLKGEGVTAREVRRIVYVSSDSNAYVLKINARHASPKLAILTANAVADSFSEQISKITGNDSIQILDYARSAELSAGGGRGLSMLIAPAAAFALACCLVAVTEVMGGRLRTVGQCIAGDDELLAVFPKVKKIGRRRG